MFPPKPTPSAFPKCLVHCLRIVMGNGWELQKLPCCTKSRSGLGESIAADAEREAVPGAVKRWFRKLWNASSRWELVLCTHLLCSAAHTVSSWERKLA